MKLTTQQAAEKLGVSDATVRHWGEEGKFERFLIGKGGLKKKYLYDAAGVNEFKRTRNGHHKPGPKLPAPPPFDDVVRAAMTKPVLRAHDVPPPTPLTGVLARLEAIESKLDYLTRVWS